MHRRRPGPDARPSVEEKHAIVVGDGRISKVVCAMLKEHGIGFVAANCNSSTVTRDRRDGHDVYFGDASDDKFLDGQGRGCDRCEIHNHNVIKRQGRRRTCAGAAA